MRPSAIVTGTLSLLGALVGTVQPSAAQLPSAGPAALGTANNHMALARGFASLGINPARLGLPGTPAFSLSALAVMAKSSMHPISFSDLTSYDGRVVPVADKGRWLETVIAAGSQRGGVVAEVTPIAATLGRLGIQISTIAAGSTDLNEDAVELMLFGNAGRTGSAGSFELEGSSLDGFAVTTIGVSFGLPVKADLIDRTGANLAVGATLKYSMGHVIVLGRDLGSVLRHDPIEVEVEFPLLHSGEAGFPSGAGGGIGLDLAAAWEKGPWSLGLFVQNVVNTFRWDQSNMRFRAGVAFFEGGISAVDFTDAPAETAPEHLLDEVSDMTFRPSIAGGVAHEFANGVTLASDVRYRFGEGLGIRPQSHVGLGAELGPILPLPLRAGIAKVTGGFLVAGGGEVRLGPAILSASLLYQTGDPGEGLFAGVGISFGSR